MYNWTLIILLSMALFSGCIEPKEEVTPTTVAPEETTAPTTSTAETEFKSIFTEADLVKVVNFLINNKGKEIELAGEKHVITGKEKLDVVISVMDCCTEEEFLAVVDVALACGEVKDSSFPSFHASVPADEIPKIDSISDVTGIKFEPEARDFWMQVVD
jgi:hypothetical protein